MKKLPIFLVKLIVLVFFLTCIQLPGVTNPSAYAVTTDMAQGYEASIKAAREAVAKELSTGIPSSATVAIMVDGKIVYAEGFGLRDRAKNLQVETDTQFNIGSISKIFTAASVLILEQEGKLSLDKPVTDYIPNFTMNDTRYKDITIRMLLNHTSGFPGSNFKDGFTAVKNRNYVEETLERLKISNLVNDPGKISIYCNDGFTIAEAVIEHVSGMSFPDFLEKRIFNKMGLDNTSAYFKDGNQNIARVYEKDSIAPLPVEYVNILGSGGISSTAIDICQYGEILQSETILNPAMIEEYTKVQYGPETVPAGKPIFNAGLGWDYVQVHKFKNQAVDVLAKNGGTLQYFSQLYVLPKEHINVAVIFAGNANPTAVANAILQALLEEKGIVKKPSSDTLLPLDAKIPDNFKGYEGFYTSDNGIMKVEISSDKNGMTLSTYDGKGFKPAGVLTYKENGRFYRPDGINYSFAEHAEGKVMMIHLDSSNAGSVSYEKLNNLSDIDASAFSGKVWVPRNMGQYDFFTMMFQTETIPEIPGYLFVNGGATYIPLALKSPTGTRMSFNYLRDQFEVLLQNIEGETLLYNYGHYYSDASKLPIIAEGDILQIDSNGQNKAGKMGSGDLVRFSIPEGGRIVVFSPELNLAYDSLMSDSPETYVEKGAYILAVGKSGNTFKITNSERFKDITGHWAKDSINQLASANILKGTGNNLYQPDKNMTGLDFLILIQRATGITPDNLSASGEETLSFKAEQPITRTQAISVLADVMALTGFEANLTTEEEVSLIKGFSDLEGIDQELKSKAALLIKLGIFQGRSNKLLAPGDTMSRGEAAATVLRMLKSIQ
ncbi:serine hydrolase [Syntrophomonas wolfei]|uniref:Beta-lactamase class C and other penicillin binding proteins-like protein n=1 Tax=Syntrophomonas wolfei subsp. wolfei (strain DSM 2245B / Goettingen) TaxID=335541 RepID=Q0B063_SYNWW|nr:serine hydrolase [Syntrophomonas wolfei]ABI67641.1 Beta-lactamase class C and other penicillin binding proteins-like protein [Syntrophomonas wolfei subsp. wolfei str. Goettingen G311]